MSWYLKMFAVWVFIAGTASASGSASDVFVRIENTVVTAGKTTDLTLAVFGETEQLPEEIEALFVQNGIEYAAILTRSSIASETVGLRRAVYSLKVPQIMAQGYASLNLPEPYAAHVVVDVEHAKKSATANASSESVAAGVIEELAEAVNEHKETFGSLGGLDVYKPIYFLGGISPTDAKFQISLRYQLFNETGRWALENPWLAGFHLGYTQVSFWDLSSQSKPFEDTNFMPEVFYNIEGIDLPVIAEGSELDLQTGFLHESNGRDEFNSRSLNVFYARLTYKHMLGEKWFARLTADVWDYVGDLSENADIADYRGHSSFRLTTGTDEGVQLSTYRRGRIGAGQASYLFDVTVPLRWEGISKNLNFSLHGQLFTGYGENLLTYNQKETRFRFGLGIHR